MRLRRRLQKHLIQLPIMRPILLTLICLNLLAACAPAPTPRAVFVLPSPTDEVTSMPIPTLTPQSTATRSAPTPLPSPTPTVRPTFAPESWKAQPVIPALSARMRAVYTAGQALGNNPRAFSKVGDCETVTDWFLDPFDRGPRFYDLGPYTGLRAVIEQFAGSFKRVSIASKRGFTAASALSPMWADPDVCKPGETPLACEFRVHRPAFVFIMLGTNDANTRATFEANLRKVVEFSLAQGVVPILATKADNIEGDESLNVTIARVAYDYEAPLWNFWLAVQPLPGRGLQADGVHLTHDKNNFGDAEAMRSAWPVRNLTALQTLDSIWRAVANR